MHIHGMLAHHPDLLQAWTPFRHHIVRDSRLTPRQRELIILRTAAQCRSDYEWQHHLKRGQMAGLSPTDMAAVALNSSLAVLSKEEQLLLLAVDQIVQTQQIEQELAEQLLTHYTAPKLLDLIATVGGYITLATILKTFDVPLEG